jgi:prolyl oligopeptidase
LQEKQTGMNPTLIRIDVKQVMEQENQWRLRFKREIDIQAFTLYNMGFKEYQNK